MDHIGIDVHKRESQIYILAEGGEVIEPRIRTEPERFDAVLGTRPRARIVLEASTDSEWVARCLEGLGHEVIVADPNFAPMYATRSRKVKTNRRDARALAEACRLGAYRPAHRLSDPQRHVRGRLVVRDALVRTRTRYISIIRALLRQLTGVDLTQIDAIGPYSALRLLAEIGPDMSRWPTEKHFTSWLTLAPHNKISGGRRLSSATLPSANRAAGILRMAAMSLRPH